MGTETGDDDELREVYGPGQPTVAAEPSAPPPAASEPPGPVRPDRAPAVLGVALVLAVLALLGALFVATKEDDEPVSAITGSSVAPTTTSTSTSTTVALTVDDGAVTTVTSTAAAAPTTVRMASTGCPTGAPGYSVDRFAWEQEAPGSDTWLLDVRGTVTNGPGATIRVMNIEVAILRGGSQVASMIVPADRQLGPNQVMDWWRDKAATTIPGGAPDAAQVSNVIYTCIG